ncbi:Translocon-associated protein beta (TRAPB) [Bacillus cereus]|nr:Translocon-associated protein beta (TRAPB) [Bacillus cereus]
MNTPTAAIGDIVTYTIAVTNTGNIPASATVLTDGLGAGASFIQNSVTINNVPQPGLDPSLGVHLADISPGDTVFITFQAQILAIPPSGTLTNNALVNYEYTVNPNQSPAVGSTVTNTTVTPIIDATLSINKTVNSTFATIGDTLTFTAIITNSGNTTANNVIFTDVIPNGTSFIPNSFTVNGTTIPNANPQNGINIGNLNSNASATLSFQVNITSLPNPNPIPNQSSLQYSFIVGINEPPVSRTVQSNKTFTQVNTASVIATKTASSAFAAVGDTITYTTTLTNSGNTTANTPVFIDILPPELSFVPDSVQINTIPQLGFRPDSGISLDSIPVGGTTTISFQAIVGSIPVTNPTLNQSSTTYSIIVDPTQPPVTETATSNPTLVQINEAIIQATKSVDRLFSDVAPGNSFLTYTVLLENIGNTTATNIIFTDPIPNNTVFIADSVRVGGVLLPGVNPANGVPIGDIIAGDFTNITFRVQVVSIPNPIFTIGPGGPNSPVVNGASIDYQFMTGPNLPLVSRSTTSNPVSTQINSGEITLVKSVDKTFATIGDTISYTITLSNPGNVTSQNIIFTDILPDGTTFISGTLTNDSGTQQIGNPANGIQIGNINPNGTAVITLNVLVTNIPSINPISNSSSVQFSHVVDPSQPSVSQMNVSNAVSTTINSAILTTQKSADKSIVSVGDTITYTTTITNTGNTAATNITFTSAIPASITFIPNSFTINGVQQSGAQPALGVTIPNIAPGETVTVTFQVNVISVPPSNSIMGNDTILYSYTVDPNGTPITTSISTNIVTNPVLDAMITMVKSVDQTLVTLGDTITYTTILTNSGNTNATNITFTDLIPDGTTFITDSVTIDGITQIGLNPNTGITIGLIAPNSSISIAFQVTATSTPVQNPIVNSATASYTFIADPNAPIVSRNVTSNTVFTTINTANILSLKQVDKSFSHIGDTLTYTVVLTNNGNSSAQNVIFTDTVPSVTTFIANTFSINGVPQSGADPSNGVNIGTITAGTTVTVSFQVTVTSLPNQNPIVNFSSTSYQLVSPPDAETSISNPVSTQINEAILSMTKNESVSFADIGQTAFYTTSITNIGNTDATNIVFTDALPSGLTFVPNTLTVDGVLQPNANPNTGVLLATLPPNEIYSIVFQVTVNSIPPINPAPNTAATTYEFIVDPVNPPVSSAATSNSTLLQINNATIISTKTADLTFADIGNTITFTLNLPNTGNTAATDVTIIDILDSNLSFVPNSFTVNGQTIPNADLSTGVNIGAINGGNAAIVTFQATVTTLPTLNPISNSASITYHYVVDPSQPSITTSNQSNTTTTQINSAILTAQKNSNVSTVDIGQDITYTVTITNSSNVSATNVIFTDLIPDGTSFEPNSFTLNGTTIPNANIITGVPIGDIAPNESVIVAFHIIANEIPAINPITNQASVRFQHIVNPANPPVSKNITSNNVTTKIESAILNTIKIGDKTFATIGDTITYTTTITNTGNIPANNTVFIDNIPEGTIFIEDSLSINNVIQPGVNPENGVTLGTIQPNETVTISFQVQLTNIPEGNTVINISDTSYEYQIDPSSPIIQRRSLSNAVNTEVRTANVSAIKSANRSITRIGQIITYTVAVTNAGTVPITNTLLIDAIAAGTTFVPNSILVDGIPRPNENPITGITLDIILPNNTIIVTFQVNVVSAPSQNNINNIAVIHYEYQPDPSLPPISETTSSNTTNIQFIDAILIATKSANTVLATIDETIEYTVLIQNNGSTTTNSIFFTDIIEDGTVFIPGSVTVNNTVLPAADPNIGFSIPNIASGQLTTITFQVSVTNLPVVNPTPNTANIVYDFIFNPDFAPIQKSTTSNTTFVQINDADIVSLKTVDLTSVTIGDILTYTTTLTNIGNADATAVVFTDNIPIGTTFIDGSVLVNNIPQLNANPSTGILVGTIAPNTSIPVTFSVTVVSLPAASGRIQNQSTSRYTINSEEQISTSNITFTEVISANIIATKTTPIQYADLQTIIPYTISITNNGNIQVENIIVTDIIPANTSFIENSVIVNGSARPNDNPLSGIQLDNIPPNTTATILFQVRVTSIPQTNPISNTSTIEYQYTLPNQPPITETIISSAAVTTINHATLNSNKTVDLAFATVGDALTYTITLNQTGNVAVNDVIIQDMIPQGTTFIENSVIVNGETLPGVNPVSGIPIGTIIVDGDAIVSFQVTVTTIPTPNELNNNAITTFNYIVNPNNVPVTNTTTTNTVTTTVQNDNVIAIKSVDVTNALPAQTLTYTITIMNSGNVTIEDLLVIDTIPIDTTFVAGSVTINGINQPNENPENGITLGNLAPNDSVIITFQVTISSSTLQPTINNDATVSYTVIIDPDEPPITITKQTNTVTTTLIEPIINIEKTADKSIVVIGDVITFTLEVFNDSTIPTISTSVIDTIPAGTTFIENSVTINGTSVPNVRPDTGINIGSLSAGTVATITFQVLVTSIPSNSTIINSATVTAAFQLTPQDPIITFIVNSNIVRIPVQFITTTVTKNASVSSAYLNQYFDYTVRITNTSKISLSNISLQDTIPAGLQFINGTVFINGERSPLANPNIGFLVATNLEPNETIIVLFTVQVISPPVTNEFKNTANISLQLQVSPTDPPITVTVTSNENIVTFVPENPDETLPNLNCFFDGERFIRITPRNIRNYLWTWIWWQ